MILVVFEGGLGHAASMQQCPRVTLHVTSGGSGTCSTGLRVPPTVSPINQILRLGLLPKHANTTNGMRKNRCLGAVRGVRCIYQWFL